eukprot:gb/GECG01010483.1/.p1 GENE.gb/GECG01010483.1/~~gb/GECG01010483.1/.p1  ORF type:complete len:185 (+),score=12.11 gb/GECG01010483.1/:1-555(+)
MFGRVPVGVLIIILLFLPTLLVEKQPGLAESQTRTETMSSGGPAQWAQRVISLGRKGRGCHLVTSEVERQVPELKNYEVGLCHLFLQHTSASISVNENADPDVRKDMEDSLNRIVPENQRYRHDAEGPDDMPAHVKSSLFGASLTIPISHGSLMLGTWQGIYLCEHRDGSHNRRLVVTLQGQTK